MKAIEITFNGKIVCRAGLPKDGNLAAILNLIRDPDVGAKKDWMSGFRVGGLSIEGGNYRFLEFFGKKMTEKDRISLRIVDVKKTSRPKKQRVETKAERLKAKKKYLKELAKELKAKK